MVLALHSDTFGIGVAIGCGASTWWLCEWRENGDLKQGFQGNETKGRRQDMPYVEPRAKQAL